MSYKVTTPPASEPLALADVKNWLKLSSGITADDDVVTMLIQAAREYVENYLQIALISQTIQEKLDAFPPRNHFRLAVGNVISVTSLTYLDSDGQSQTLAQTDYGIDVYSQHARIYLKEGKSWPDSEVEKNAITITYVAGWSTAGDVPAKIKLAMYKYIADNYHLRGDNVKRFTTAVDLLLDQIRQEIFWEYA